jgi:hypothetical protein
MVGGDNWNLDYALDSLVPFTNEALLSHEKIVLDLIFFGTISSRDNQGVVEYVTYHQT